MIRLYASAAFMGKKNCTPSLRVLFVCSAALAAVESAYLIRHGGAVTAQSLDLSEQQVVSCATEAFSNMDGCNGGMLQC